MECAKKGYFAEEQIKFPSEERLRLRPVAVAECCQMIPCNPCVDACPAGAILMEHNINYQPVIDFERCTGCGLCLGVCPGLSLFLMDMSRGEARVTIPYELFPPEQGERVVLLNRAGEEIGEGEVVSVRLLKQHDRTHLVVLKVPEDQIRHARGFRRLS